MHTLMVITGGLGLLAAFLLAGRVLGGGATSVATAAKAFIPVWLAAALINLWIGVAHAGYSVAQELPFFVVVFGVPAAAAAFAIRSFSGASAR